MPHTANSGSFSAKDWTGFRNGKLTALEDTGKKGENGSHIWLCRCDCGNTVEIPSQRLNRVKSCGCQNKVKLSYSSMEKECNEPDLDGEEWRQVEGYSNYEVSNRGRIRSVNYLGHGAVRMMSPHPDAHGFLRVSLSEDGKRKSHKMHRLVATAFVDKPTGKENGVKHIDGDKQNNNAENLKWVILQEQISEEYATGKRKQHGNALKLNPNGTFQSKDRTGERHWNYVVLKDTGKTTKYSGHIWLARCDCGNEFEIPAGKIGKIKSCGCLARTNSGTRKAEDLTGYRTRGFEVVSKTERRDPCGYVIWIGKCENCGNEKELPSYFYKRGIVRCDCDGWNEKYGKKAGRRALPKKQSHINALFNGYMKGAEARGLEFKLTKEQFVDIIERDCYYCGAKPRIRSSSKQCAGEFFANGIDRVNNDEGYTIENCVTCCTACNYMKGRMKKEDFLEQAKKICSYTSGGD